MATSRDFFGLATATPVQRAFLRIASGKPLGDLATHPDVVFAMGGEDGVAALFPGVPKELMLLSGIRVGKSLIAALLCVYWSQVADVSRLGPGEIPRISILSIAKDNAIVILDHIIGRVSASAKLKSLIIGDPTKEEIVLRHPSGVPIEIRVVAGARAGATLVSRWSAGCVADEFPRWVGEGEGVINWDDSRRAVLDRILPNCQFVSIGSPYAPVGPAYDAVQKYHGKPTQDAVLLKAPAWMLNPFYWTPEKIEESKRDPDVHVTDCLADFASPEESLFNAVEIDSCVRKAPMFIAPDPALSYVAAMDPATRSNGWTLIIATKIGNRKIVVRCEERRGTKLAPLKPREVMIDFASILADYGIGTICSDQHLADAIKEIAQDLGLFFKQIDWQSRIQAKKYQSLKTRMALAEVELPPDPMLRNDLIQIRKRSTNNGVKIMLPNSSDGRHCDYAPALVMALSHYIDDKEPDELTEGQRQLALENAMKQKRMESVRRRIAQDSKMPSAYNRLKGKL